MNKVFKFIVRLVLLVFVELFDIMNIELKKLSEKI